MFSTRNFVIFLKYRLSIHHFLSYQKPLVDISLQIERLRFSVTVLRTNEFIERIPLADVESHIFRACSRWKSHNRLYTLGVKVFKAA